MSEGRKKLLLRTLFQISPSLDNYNPLSNQPAFFLRIFVHPQTTGDILENVIYILYTFSILKPKDNVAFVYLNSGGILMVSL